MPGKTKSNFSPEYIERFAKAFNNVKDHPRLDDVGEALGISYQTVRNRASDIRKQQRREKVPVTLIWRGLRKKPAKEEKPKVSPSDQAKKRALDIKSVVDTLFQSTNWPVINPEALVIQDSISRRFDANLGEYIEVAGAPRTWLSDTLRVEPITDYRGKKFILTGAQNDSELHEELWENLEAYSKHLGAPIIVGPWTYETNWWDENNPLARDYDDRIMEHLCFGQLAIGPDFVFCGEMNTLPTSPRPLNDLTSYTGGRWGVFPHARLQLLSVPSTDPTKQAHQIMTTGAVTRPKVIPRKAGIKTIFHHVFGATLVEFDMDGNVFCRQINASKDGSFYDLDVFVTNGQVIRGQHARAITFADLHIAKLGAKNALATFGFDYRTGAMEVTSLLDTLRPEHIFLEDIHDNEKGSHHREKDVNFHYEMALRGRDDVEKEVARSTSFLQQIQRPGTKVHVVESNHDVHLERWVREGRYRTDGGHNLAFGLKLDVAYNQWRKNVAEDLDAERKPTKFSLLEWAIRDQAGPLVADVHWIYDGADSFVLDGIELGHHGHRGQNGAHGTPGGFAKLGRRMSIGDKHSPQIMDGVFVAGSMELQHGYNKGPSGWAVTHIVQYPNGKRTLITLQNGKWRA